ncbi:response regulator [Ketobacter sp.]|uniref:response regulator n=1 Tax=Ketobacter sp. TaxID=2083498 RepID=UPI000F0DE385|nr:response regulator [Ketobacter sp.]RLU01262.1 MAG: response regulator [Ketobacter sp.]
MAQTATLLVVDDEPELVEILQEYFQGKGYHVVPALNAAAARLQFAQRPPDVMVLDIHMPGEDGLSLARWCREHHPRVGIIMLTTAGEVVDRIVGLEMGADDYIPKPFDLREVLARVKGLLRRLEDGEPPAPSHGRIRFGATELDLNQRKLRDGAGNEIAITSMEFDLLKTFSDNPNRVLNRDQLMELAHNKGWDVFDRSIDLRIMRLRRKIEAEPEKPEIIKTVRGVGYMYVSDCRR